MAGFIASGTMMYAASYAAFTSNTTNATNNWNAGTVVLNDDDGNAAMFTTAAPSAGQISGARLKPGQAVTNCIAVTYTGNIASTVKLYATAVSENNGVSTGLLSYLHVKVEEGTGGGFGSCGGFSSTTTLWDSGTHPGVGSDLLSVYPTTYAAGYSSATASWTNGDSQTYRFTITMDALTPDTSQGATATATFNWQAYNS